MKKITAILTCLCLFVSSFVSVSALETEVIGLHENLEELWIKNNFTYEQLEELDNKYMEYKSDDLINRYIPLAFKTYENKTNTPEDEYELLMHEAVLDYDKGIKISLLNTEYYYNQYALNGVFEYLFDDYYWYVRGKNTWHTQQSFEKDGNFLSYYSWNQKYPTGYSFYFEDMAFEFISDEEKIKSLILEKGETEVSDIKIFCGVSNFPIMYINCNGNEYFAKLYDTAYNEPNRQFLHTVNLFQLYSSEEFWGELDKTPKLTEAASKSGQFAERARKFKNTFATEAKALQSDGLLYGNEKGLDLLKPLTRIEAAAIILRAAGKSEATNLQATEVFSDIPESHWGYEIAHIASNEGIILGNGDSTFAPDRQVSANEFATMVLRCGSIDDFQWENALDALVEKGILTSKDTEGMAFFTRGDMAKIIFEARNKRLISA